MSVSTECSFRTESDWDPQSESSSMISFDMSQPHSPTSHSKFFKVGLVNSFYIEMDFKEEGRCHRRVCVYTRVEVCVKRERESEREKGLFKSLNLF